MHPEETKVHRRGLVLAPGLAANRAYTKKQRDRAAQQRNELASSYVGHGAPPRNPLCQLTAGLRCHGSTRRSLGKPEMF